MTFIFNKKIIKSKYKQVTLVTLFQIRIFYVHISIFWNLYFKIHISKCHIFNCHNRPYFKILNIKCIVFISLILISCSSESDHSWENNWGEMIVSLMIYVAEVFSILNSVNKLHICITLLFFLVFRKKVLTVLLMLYLCKTSMLTRV